jgi:glycosyltransferase involved in cell wall biosynthesis
LKKLVYITDLASTRSGGGSYAVNWHIQDQLRKYFELSTPAPIVPDVSSWEKFMSRVQRHVLKRPGKFFYFSPSTLDSNARRASRCFQDSADGVVFRSATRWCHCRPKVPYFVYLDVVFHTFFENTFDEQQFVRTDRQRIFQTEARFLENASAVFFESNWGLQKAKEAYGLAGSHYFNASRGGVIDPPDRDVWTDEKPFLLSVAKNFEQKGGDMILSAFKKLKEGRPELGWIWPGSVNSFRRLFSLCIRRGKIPIRSWSRKPPILAAPQYRSIALPSPN